MKNFKLLAVLFLLVAMLTSACGDENSAPLPKSSSAADMKTFCEAVFHLDESALKKVNVSKDEYQNLLTAEFTKSFLESSGVNFSEQQINLVSEAFLNLLKRVNIETRTVSENDNKAVVDVTVDVFQTFNENLLMSKLPQDIAEQPEEVRIDEIAKAIAATLNDLKKISNSTVQATCTYSEENEMWLPDDTEGIGELLITRILNVQ